MTDVDIFEEKNGIHYCYNKIIFNIFLPQLSSATATRNSSIKLTVEKEEPKLFFSYFFEHGKLNITVILNFKKQTRKGKKKMTNGKEKNREKRKSKK